MPPGCVLAAAPLDRAAGRQDRHGRVQQRSGRISARAWSVAIALATEFQSRTTTQRAAFRGERAVIGTHNGRSFVATGAPVRSRNRTAAPDRRIDVAPLRWRGLGGRLHRWRGYRAGIGSSRWVWDRMSTGVVYEPSVARPGSPDARCCVGWRRAAAGRWVSGSRVSRRSISAKNASQPANAWSTPASSTTRPETWSPSESSSQSRNGCVWHMPRSVAGAAGGRIVAVPRSFRVAARLTSIAKLLAPRVT